MAKEYYFKILSKYLFKDYPILREQCWKYKTYVVKKFLNDDITTLDWRSYSPDLNSIENVWRFIKERLFNRNSQLIKHGKKLKKYGI